MAVFSGRVSEKDLREKFIYRGWLYGIVPVYVGDVRKHSPELSVRNGVPEFVLDLVEAIVGVMLTLSPNFQPSHPIKLTARLDGKPLEAYL